MPFREKLTAAAAHQDARTQERLMHSVSAGNVVAVRNALGAGADPNLAHVDADPSSPKLRTWTPLGLAVVRHHPDVVQALLDGGADPNLADPCGDAPLHLVGEANGELEAAFTLIDRLIGHGADPNRRVDAGEPRQRERVRPKTTVGDTPLLTWLTYHRRWPLAERLLRHPSVDATARRPNQQTGLHRMMDARWNGHPLPKAPGYDLARFSRLVTTLIGRGVAVDAMDQQGQVPLDLALFLNPVVQTLIEAGGPMIPSTQNRLALSAASTLDLANTARIATALDLGAARGEKGTTVVHHWARGDRLAHLEQWCAPDGALRPLLDRPDQRGDTPLGAAIKVGALDAVRWLLGQGANVRQINREGDTLLMVALNANPPGLDALMLMLAEHGAEADRCNRHGVSALSRTADHPGTPWRIAWERRQLSEAVGPMNLNRSPVIGAGRRRL